MRGWRLWANESQSFREVAQRRAHPVNNARGLRRDGREPTYARRHDGRANDHPNSAGQFFQTPRVSFSSAPKASIEDRLRGQPGIFEGVRLPRLRHWSGHLLRAYRSAFSLCARIGVRNLVIQLHVNRNPDDVAIAVLPGFKKRDWRAAHQGCADGLAWDTGRR